MNYELVSVHKVDYFVIPAEAGIPPGLKPSGLEARTG